ncbi:nucleotide exchange factor GrpE [Sulfuriflexus sp.]|uniref:nucleotide exchange factor GrpE n=1 Tax=Sulfuriflexus sp. TaxID=2015443 RepID=UPI0028CE4A92|nr:nucleotide exchange factor GrpE [Sulfuriflexus sp.]MDT8404722.1 nucleotide exchange factor GrpE [Sulfuriflexus sp.]
MEKLRAALAECEKALEITRQESDERQDSLLRAYAELDNERKKALREIDKMQKFAIDRLLIALLPIKDSLELGLQTAGDTLNPQSLSQGMQLTLDKLSTVFADFGIETIDPQGEQFNPQYHEAVDMEPMSDVPPNTVCHVQQKGYVLNGRVVRAARVTVSTVPQTEQH